MPVTLGRTPAFRFALSALALAITAALAACSGGDSNEATSAPSAPSTSTPPQGGSAALVIPAPPQGLGFADHAQAGAATTPAGRSDVPPHRIDARVDSALKGHIDPTTGYALNNAGTDDACYADEKTNLSIRALKGFLAIWQPTEAVMNAHQKPLASSQVTTKEGATIECPAIAVSQWSGIPGEGFDGTVLQPDIHRANLAYSGKVTAAANRGASQTLAAYLDDARGKSYSVSLGLGPLAQAWHGLAKQKSYIDAIPSGTEGLCPDGQKGKYPFCSAPDEDQYNVGEGVSHSLADAQANNPAFGRATNFIQRATADGSASTNAPKFFYKYARPYRWADAGLTSERITVSSGLENARKIAANGASAADIRKDGDFPSGHTAEAVRGALAYGYLVPERFQEMLARGMEVGENRIVAGMHSALAVMGGRMSGETAALNLINRIPADERAAAYAQAQQALRQAAVAQIGASAATDAGFMAYAHSSLNAKEVAPFVTPGASHADNKREYRRRMTYDFAQDPRLAGQPVVVPVGAETLLETRLPYLSAEQRRTVLKTTAIDSGYPVLDDEEGFGRLNYFDAADGYGDFKGGDVEVRMDAALGGFNARDAWRNDITGAGKLTKLGTGTLALTGTNHFTGGVVVSEGVLEAASAQALGDGTVYLDHTGTLAIVAPAETGAQAVRIRGPFVQTGRSTLQVALQAGDAAPLQMANTAILDKDSILAVTLPENAAAGQVYPVLQAQSVQGQFGTIALPPGVKAEAIYAQGSVRLRIQ